MSAMVSLLSRAYADSMPNPNYPEEDFEAFVVRAIERKKHRIETELDIEETPPRSTV